jgi:hypothetical protein
MGCWKDSITHKAAVHCFTGARLHRLELSLRTSVRLSDDEATMVKIADLAIQTQRRRHAHEAFCPVCLGQGETC